MHMNKINSMLLRACAALLAGALLLMSGCSALEAGNDSQHGSAQTEPTPDTSAEQTPEQTPAAAEPTPTAEEPQPSPALPEAYEAIVALYADAMENEYYSTLDAVERDIRFGETTAAEWLNAQMPAYYALHDFDGNGTEELLIASVDGDNTTYYDIFSMEEGNAVRLFPDMSFGYRTNLDICADGTLAIVWSSSAFESGMEYYRVNGAEAECITSVLITTEMDGTNTTKYIQDGTEISEEAFDALTAEYEAKGRASFEWISVTQE